MQGPLYLSQVEASGILCGSLAASRLAFCWPTADLPPLLRFLVAGALWRSVARCTGVNTVMGKFSS